MRKIIIIALAIVIAGLVWFHKPVFSYINGRFLGAAVSPPSEIVIWHTWGGTQKELFEKVVKEFEKTHPNIKVKVVFAPNDLSNNQKFFSAVTAGKPPDVTFVDGPQVSEWAEQGALQPLDSKVTAARIKPDDYFTPCWKQNYYDGHVWAVTYCADPNFGFAWNKKAFRDAGQDPNNPPATIEDMDKLAEKLTRRGKRGITSIGIIPWGQFGNANSMYTWGWAFGGKFYDEKTHKVTANDPKNVKALEWMCSYAKKYGLNDICSLQQGFGNLDRNPFYIGQLGMTCLHIAQVADIRKYAPRLDYGLCYIPSPPGGEAHSSWIGGWCMALPRGSRKPELGWEFIRWMCADAEGTAVAGRTQDLFPGYRKSLFFDEIKSDPRYGPFVEVLEQCKHQRPVMPAQAYYMGALDRAVGQAIYGKMTPKAALDQATKETQRELDLRLAGE